ncbi:hypothetical protein ACFLRC_02185 [Candidatus Altiarchaeota archaeon]
MTSKMNIIDGYPEYMRESIDKVEKTRSKRLKQTYRQMNLDDREKVLNKFHPDYKKDQKREVTFGPNKGDLMPHEVVDLIEAHSVIDPKEIDLSILVDWLPSQSPDFLSD